MNVQILIRIDKSLKEALQRLSKKENKSTNEKICELIGEYVTEHSMETAMKKLWDDISVSLKKKGYTRADVNRAIKRVRKGT
ncbi:MAG: hypothetical protein A2Y62_03295 [Candidatus Fischerbacteria bacterium RBG_13_37_8]|uniref:CopG family transcriptional regulator n=1 Tax=Candidatus Fischerbacteria bacterium RBG_13_37_8 TaxID=1817863 RepID=A0A1F5VVJ1_9BACT|nr:MAG: hypothetical protein A2Y62_03295 [Candidatus Fischerbacteria bacterium RBG_13_37_8]